MSARGIKLQNTTKHRCYAALLIEGRTTYSTKSVCLSVCPSTVLNSKMKAIKPRTDGVNPPSLIGGL